MRITDTLAWFLDNLQLPDPSVHDLLIAAIHDLTTTLQTITSTHPAFHHRRQLSNIPTITEQLLDIAALYNPTSDPILPIDAVNDTSDATEQRVQIPLAPILTNITLPAALYHPLAHTSPTEQRVPDTDIVPSPQSMSEIDALPNIPLQASQQPPTIPKPPSPPVTRQHTARQRANAALNLAADGSLLTYSKAKAGPDAARWLQAEAEELDGLLMSHTIKAILQCDQPTDRRRDTTYFNPQTKQKIDSTGSTTYRIRGTAGGDQPYNSANSCHASRQAFVAFRRL